MTSFGTTISSGIQDISAILSLFGTEQCEFHVGSALRGGGRGGYMYAAITPISIFGSLGAAKAAFTIMLVGLPFGPRILKYVGFEPKGDVVAAAMLESNSDRYLAETRLLHLLDKHYIRSAQHISIERPDVRSPLTPLRPWDFSLLVASLFVACLGVLPYIHFSVLGHTTFPALAIFFPICRVTGGLLCVFPGQLLLQYRIQTIIKQRLFFKGINDILKEYNTKAPAHRLLWDDTHSSQACLSSLIDFLRLRPTPTRFVKHLATVLHVPPECSSKELEDALQAYLANTWSWLALTCALLLGFLMTIVGYIGCFTIVQSSSVPSDTYIWLGSEATLAFIRLLVWGLNPSWDDSDGICLALTEMSPLPAVTPTWVAINNKQFPMFKIMGETEFWQTLTAFSGPVDIPGDHPRGSRRWETVLCRLDNTGKMKFYRADVGFNTGHVVQKEELKKDHELMKEETNFKLDIFKHYHFVISTKNRSRDHVGPMRASWPLSESSVTNVSLASIPRRRDAEHGDYTYNTVLPPQGAWSHLVKIMNKLLAGTELEYNEISTCRQVISNIPPSNDLSQRVSDHLSRHARKIYAGAKRKQDHELKDYYNEEWEVYSKAVIYLDRLFGSLTVNRAVGDRQSKAHLEALVNVALTHWESDVLKELATQLSGLTSYTEVDRIQTLFASEDWTWADFWEMKIKAILKAGLVQDAQEYNKALQAASSSGHTAIVRLLVEKGADINPDGIPVLQTASSSGQLDVVRILLDSGADVNAESGEFHTAIHAASYKGHEEIVHFLLDTGADINRLGGRYGSALQAASYGGHTTIVSLLVEKGADIHAKGGEFHTALQAASFGGHAETVHVLLEAGADINESGGTYGGALKAASYEGRITMISLLIEKGADINAKGGEFHTALQAASYKGHAETVRVLLEAGADINESGGTYGSALQAASYGGHTTIVSLFIEKGADISAKGGEFHTALQAAAHGGHAETVRVLLEAGADINESGGTYGSALKAAAYTGHEETVRILVEKGADNNAKGGEFHTVLQAASYRGHAETIRVLLEAGVDINKSGGTYGSALQAAAYKGHEETVRILVEKGADINAKGGRFHTALQAACYRGHAETVRVLLEAGADINESDKTYGSALQVAAYKGHEETVRILLQNGADINARDMQSRIALHAASYKGHSAVIHLLLEQGADINITGGEYWTALQAAACQGHIEAVCRLIEAHADVNAVGGSYGNALQAACYEGHRDIVLILLEAGADTGSEPTGEISGNALQAASYGGRSEIVRLLLARGADISKDVGEPHRLLTIVQQASAFSKQGRFKEAEALEIVVLQQRKKVLGESHPDTLVAMSNLGATYMNLGELKMAEDLQIVVMEQRKRVLGNDHPDTMLTISNLVTIFSTLGQFKKAEELEIVLLEKRQELLGNTHPDTLEAMSSLASTYRNLGEFKKAEELEIGLLSRRQEFLSDAHPVTLEAMSNLTSTFDELGELKREEELEIVAVEGQKRVLGDDHLDTMLP
ncbi:hypothetical protein MVEN_01633400 [Mycena venus]|uniref:Uncharacterized protein n=1 Tax=Mycena venus TaxID=2733690 RepID=A0A8H7CQN8_9AGAR|nr:hypothetical protein MVEN_01633400 [Mycena venus]